MFLTENLCDNSCLIKVVAVFIWLLVCKFSMDGGNVSINNKLEQGLFDRYESCQLVTQSTKHGNSIFLIKRLIMKLESPRLFAGYTRTKRTTFRTLSPSITDKQIPHLIIHSMPLTLRHCFRSLGYGKTMSGPQY